MALFSGYDVICTTQMLLLHLQCSSKYLQCTMFGEEAHGSQAMMCEAMRLTVVSIIIEKSFFEVKKMPLSGIKPLTTSL